MDRRNFLRNILGVAAATALPSEVWPFRKIFLPPTRRILLSDLSDIWVHLYSHSIPDLIYAPSPLFVYMKREEQLKRAMGMSVAEYPGRLRHSEKLEKKLDELLGSESRHDDVFVW